jgi:TolB-like protein/DNA-binding winged helix-turn-helix (wHTH) protein
VKPVEHVRPSVENPVTHTEPAGGADLYRVGDLLVDPECERVSRDDHEIALAKLTFDLFITLVQAAPNLVRYDDLMQRVWPGLVVGVETVTQRAKKLREALHDDPSAPRYIEAVRGRGYRIVAPVVKVRRELLAGGSAQVQDPVSPLLRPRGRVLALAAVVCALGLAVVAVTWLTERSVVPARTTLQPDTASPLAVSPASVAVVPFANLTGDPSMEYFSDGMAEELINELTRVPGLKVPARTSSFAYKRRNADIREIARDLGVQTIVEGSVRSVGERIRITAQLVNAQTGYSLWSQTYDRQFGDVFQLQDEIAHAIVQALTESLSVDQLSAAFATAPPPTLDPEAYRLYLQGRSVFAYSLAAGLTLTEQAIARDPMFARAIGQAALIYAISLPEGAPLQDALAHAERYARKALVIAPHVGDAYSALAIVNAARGDWLESESNFRQALQVESGDSAAHDTYMLTVLSSMGQTRRVLQEAQVTYSLAPGSAAVVAIIAAVYSHAGMDSEALRYADVAGKLSAGSETGENAYLRSSVYVNAALREGRYDVAAERFLSRAPAGMHSASAARTIREVFAAFGSPADRAVASQALTTLVENLAASDLDALVRKTVIEWYAMLGDLDAAYRFTNEWIDELAMHGTVGGVWDVFWIPEMRAFRQDGRFQGLVQRLRLTQYWRQYGPPDDCELRGETLECR